MMDVPTDNLYKFMAVGGIILVIAGVYYPPIFFHQTGMEYLAQLRTDKEYKVHQEFISQRLKTLAEREQKAKNQRTVLETRLAGLNQASNTTEVDKLRDNIKQADREIDSLADSAHDLRLSLAVKKVQSDYEETASINRRRDSRYGLVFGWVVALIGAGTSIIGFRRWYRRLQKFQDRLFLKEAEAKLAAPTASEAEKPAQPSQPPPGKPPEPAK